MLKMRVIPTLLWKDVGLVKGIGFNSWRRVDSVLPAVKVYNMRQVDELILLDISATVNNKEPDYDSIKDFAKECSVPLTIGGGINNVEHIKNLLRSGADKVVINTAAYENPNIIKEASTIFGRQCIVAGIDVRKNNGKYECYSRCATKATGYDPVEWAQKMEQDGAGEIFLTSVERDGTMNGYDIELVKNVSSAVNVPVIASGGAGKYEDSYEVISKGKASAVAMASVFHFTEQTPLELKNYLMNRGILVRNVNIEQ